MSIPSLELTQDLGIGPRKEELENEELEGGQSVLIQACLKGDVEAVTRILKECPPHLRDECVSAKDGRTPVMIAAGHQDDAKALAMVKLLCEAGASIQAVAKLPDERNKSVYVKDEYKEITTSLHEACKHGNIQTATYLLEQDRSLAQSSYDDYIPDDNDTTSVGTPLMAAVEHEDGNKALALTKLLVEAGADIRTVSYVVDARQDAASATTAFLQACKTGHLKVVEYLLEKDSSLANEMPRNVDHYVDGRTPLVIAAGYKESSLNKDFDNDLALVELLLKHGADHTLASHCSCCDGSYYEGETAFAVAILRNNIKLADRLLQKDPSLAREPVVDECGPSKFVSPLVSILQHLCDQEDDMLKFLTLLLAPRADIAAFTPDECEPVFFTACLNPEVEVVEFLLKRYPSLIDAVSDKGHSAIEVAASDRVSAWEVVKTLLKWNPRNLDANSNGETVLGLALQAGEWGVARTLLEQGASLQLKNDPAITLRHYSEVLSRDASKKGTRTRIIFDSAKILFDIAEQGYRLSDEDRRILSKSLQELGLALNGRVDGETALQAAIRSRDELIQLLGRGGSAVHSKETLLEMMQEKEEFIGELLVAGAALFLSKKEEEEARAVSLPIFQAFLALKDFNNSVEEAFIKLNEAPSEQDSKESKETSERHAEMLKNVRELPTKVLSMAATFSPKVRNKLCYELAICLEKTLPYTGGESSENIKVIVKAFAQVSYEGGREFHEKANAKLLHYQTLSKGRNMGRGLGISGVEEDAEMPDAGVLALQAKREIDPAFLGQTLVARIFPAEFRPCIFGQVMAGDSFELNLSRVFNAMQQEVSRLHREVSNLRKEKEKLESRISKSSIPYSSLSLDPEAEAKQGSERARSPQTSSSSSSSQSSSSSSSSQFVSVALPESGGKGAVASADGGQLSPDPLFFGGPKGEKRKPSGRTEGSLPQVPEFSVKRVKT